MFFFFKNLFLSLMDLSYPLWIFSIPYGPFQIYLLQLILPSPSCSTAFSAFWQDPSICLSFHFLSFLYYGPLEWYNPKEVLFLLIKTVSELTLGNQFVSQKSHWDICILFSRRDSGLWLCYLLARPNFVLLHNSLLITFPTQSCLVLYSFGASFLH